MTEITITNVNETTVVKSTLFDNFTVHHQYLIINDIYKLAHLAKHYYFYNAIYSSFDSSIAEKLKIIILYL